MAQARFFRAFAYRNLGELYGGVPLVTEITTTPRYDFKRSSRLETYQYAIDELEAILNDLPETTGTMGRLVRGAAQHNLKVERHQPGVQTLHTPTHWKKVVKVERHQLPIKKQLLMAMM